MDIRKAMKRLRPGCKPRERKDFGMAISAVGYYSDMLPLSFFFAW